MENKKRALGRGLEQLFNSDNLNMDMIEEEILETASRDEIVEINLDELKANPYQPRKHFDDDALNELADSIKEHGVFQPIIVKKTIKGYHIIAGERRVRASKIAGRTTVPAIIRDFDDELMMQIALLENLQRENLTAIEEALAYKNIIEHMSITQDELAKKVGKTRSHITNLLGLLNLPKQVQDMVLENKLSMAHARHLSKLDDVDTIINLSEKIVDKGLTVRDLEKEIKLNDLKKRVIISRKQTKETEFVYIEKHLKEKLGTKVNIKPNKVEIKFENKEDLNRILEILNIDMNQ